MAFDPGSAIPITATAERAACHETDHMLVARFWMCLNIWVKKQNKWRKQNQNVAAGLLGFEVCNFINCRFSFDLEDLQNPTNTTKNCLPKLHSLDIVMVKALMLMYTTVVHIYASNASYHF